MTSNRCLLVSPDFPPPMIGGSLVYIKTLLENSNQEFDVLTGPINNSEPEVLKYPHKVIRSNFIINSNQPSSYRLAFSYLFILFWVSSKIISGSYRIVVANPGAVGNSLLFLLGKILRVKVIGVAYAEELTVPLLGKGTKNLIKRSLLKYSYRKASGFVVVCHFCKEILINKLSVSEGSIDVIASCLSKEKFKDLPQDKINGNSILSVGRLIERKGFRYLIKSVARIQKKIPDLVLNIVGSGPLESDLVKLIIDLKAEEYITISTGLNDTSLSSLYQNADLFILANYCLSNGDTEGCPSVFSEAMAYGLPVIGGKGAGVETAIIHNENGLIINTSDPDKIDNAIKDLLTDKNKAKLMASNGRRKLFRDHHPEVVGKSFGLSIERFLEGSLAADFQAEFNKTCPSLNKF